MDHAQKANGVDASDSRSDAHSRAAMETNAGFEATIAGIWKDLLGLPAIGMDENFFEVGGTSLLATTLLSRINQKLERALPIATVFEHATIRSQAAFLRGEPVAGEAVLSSTASTP
jgi:hypothetical protein